MELLILIAIVWLFISRNKTNAQSAVTTESFSNGQLSHTLSIDASSGKNYILLIGPEQFVYLKLSGAEQKTEKFVIGHMPPNLNNLHEGIDWFTFQSTQTSQPFSHSCLRIDAVYGDGKPKEFASIHVIVVPKRIQAKLIKYSSGLESKSLRPPSEPNGPFAGTDRTFAIEPGKIYFAVGAPGHVVNFRFREDAQFGFPAVQCPSNALQCQGIYPVDDTLKEYVYSWSITGFQPEGGWCWCRFPVKDGSTEEWTCIFVVQVNDLTHPYMWQATPSVDSAPAPSFFFSSATMCTAPSPYTPNYDTRLGGPTHYGYVVNRQLWQNSSTKLTYSYGGYGTGNYSRTSSVGDNSGGFSGASAGKTGQSGKTTTTGFFSPDFSNFSSSSSSDYDIEVPRMQRSSTGAVYSSYRGQTVRGTRQSGSYGGGIRTGSGNFANKMSSNIPRRDKAWGKSSYTVGDGRGSGKGRRK